MKKNIAAAFVCMMMLGGCYRDDSTGAQMDLRGVSIAADDGLEFTVGVEGTYEPVIEWDGTTEDDYTYLWTFNGRKEISTERVLKHIFTDEGVNYLTFQMTDKKTGLVYGQDFKMTATSKFFIGWLILSEGESGSSHLSFVDLSTFTTYPDIYATMYPDVPLGSSPVGLANQCGRKTDQVTVIQDGGDGTVILDGKTFGKVVDLSGEFIGGESPEEDGGFSVAAIAYTHRGPDLVISKNGNIYDRITKKAASAITAFQTSMYSTEPFIPVAGASKFTATTFPGAASEFTPLFDSANNRWLAYYTTTMIPQSIPALDKADGLEFDPGFDYCTGMDSDVSMEYAQTYNETSQRTALCANVLKKGSDYYINTAKWSLVLSNYHITVSDLHQHAINVGVAPEPGSKFFIPRSGSLSEYYDDLYVFFSVGKRVYFYHFDTETLCLYHDFSKDADAPSGNVVCMVQNGDASQMGVSFSDGHFFVCDLKKKNLTDIRQGNIDPETFDGMVKAHVKDIPGTIVSAIFKYGKADNYTGSKIAK